MKRISKWAQAHPIQSIYIIALCHILAGINALFFGVLLFLYHWTTPTIVVLGLAHLFSFLYIFYPKKTRLGDEFRRPYFRQKVHDFGLVFSCCLVISMAFANFLLKDNPALNRSQRVEARFIVHDPNTSSKKSIFSRIKSSLNEKVAHLKTKVTYYIQETVIKYELQEKGSDQTTKKALLTILILGLSIGFAGLIAALSCNLSCSGQEGAAIIVAVLGFGTLIWLAIYAIREIWGMSKNGEDINVKQTT